MAKVEQNHKLRLEIEELIYKTYDAVDKTGANTDYYRGILSKMDDKQFFKFLARRQPFRYQLNTFKNTPKMSDIIKGFKVINKPLLEKVKCPYIYKNKDGVPIETKECLVVYINVPRMKQMLIKKNSNAIDISARDKTGLLLGKDKGGKMSDREFQSLAASNLDYTMDEFAGFKGDAMRDKQLAYATIAQTGMLKYDDLQREKDDSLSRNMISAMLIGSNIMSNLVCEDYMTPYTLKQKKLKAVQRI